MKKKMLYLRALLYAGVFYSVSSFCNSIPVKLINTTLHTFSLETTRFSLLKVDYGTIQPRQIIQLELCPAEEKIEIKQVPHGKLIPGSTKTFNLHGFPVNTAIYIYDTDLPWLRHIYGWDAKLMNLGIPRTESGGVILPFGKNKAE